MIDKEVGEVKELPNKMKIALRNPTIRKQTKYLIKNYGMAVGLNYLKVMSFGCEAQNQYEGLSASKTIEFQGKSQTISEWAKDLNVGEIYLMRKIAKYGETDPRCFKPNMFDKAKIPITFNGKSLTSEEWAKELGLSLIQFKNRVRTWGADNPRTFQENVLIDYKRTFFYEGIEMNAHQWAAYLNITVTHFKKRIKLLGEDNPNVFKRCNLAKTKTSRGVKSVIMINWDNQNLSLNEWAEKLNINRNTLIKRVKNWGICEKTFTYGNSRKQDDE